jgi:hypothetical protein
MQFLVYSTAATRENTPPPTPEQMEAIGNFMVEAMMAGKIVATGSLANTGVRLQSESGKFSVTDGPFIEAKELTGGFAIIKAESLEEAIEWCKRFRIIVGDGESEIVRVYGPDDFA